MCIRDRALPACCPGIIIVLFILFPLCIIQILHSGSYQFPVSGVPVPAGFFPVMVWRCFWYQVTGNDESVQGQGNIPM